MPDRDPDLKVDIRTTPNQALIYRLSGDYNPLHIDPDAAEAAGFPKPILHGLCTYGITCRAVLSAYAEYDAARICEHAVRFSAPVFPGETITVDLWQDGDVVSFEAGVKERGAKVIRAGRARLTET
jgi:acyl dehydratase